jgi:outer membrane cobalamin receptor
MFRTLDNTHQQRSNIAQTQTDGATATYARALGACSRASLWTTLQNARVTTGPSAIVGKQLQYVPNTSAGVTFDTRTGNMGVGVTASYLGQTYADDLNAQPLGTAVLLGAQLRIPLHENANVVIEAENLTNARYLSSVDRLGPPATVAVRVVLPLAASGAQPRATECVSRSESK